MNGRTVDHFLLPATGAFASRSLSSRAWFQVLAGAGVIALAAQVRIPVPGTAVPMTLQSLAVLVLGLTMAPSRSVGAVVLYVLAGTIGLPVFAANSLGLFGPTGGYLMGFVPAVWMTAVLRGSGPATWLRLAACAAIGIGIIMTSGVLWLSWWSGASLSQAILLGLAPFAVKAMIEVVLAAGVAGKFLSWRSRVQNRSAGSFSDGRASDWRG